MGDLNEMGGEWMVLVLQAEMEMRSAPDDSAMLKVMVSRLARWPGVEGVAITRAGEVLAASPSRTEFLSKWGSALSASLSPHIVSQEPCPARAATLTVALSVASRSYGEVVVVCHSTEDAQRCGLVLKHVAALAGLLAEHRLQGETLKALYCDLEKAVRDRTEALERELAERSRVEAALRASEERFRIFMEHTPAVMFMKDEEGRYVTGNRAWAGQFGKKVEEVLGKTDFDLWPEATARAFRETDLMMLRTGQIVDAVEEGTTMAGEEKSWGVLKFPVRRSDGSALVCAIVQDITERKLHHAARLRLEKQIQEAQKLESLGVLAGGIAHDFNNILTAIMGNLNLAMDQLSPAAPERNELMEATKATRRAADLTKQMLAYSGKGRFVVKSLSLREVVEEMVPMLEVSASKKAVLHFQYAASLPFVEVDVSQLQQVIMNLVVNASEALGDRSGTISLTVGAMECDRTYLSTTYLGEPLGEGTYVFLEVADTGCGIEKERLNRVFDPFYTTKFTGRGLGLAAVLGIVRGHKGAITVYSEVGKGTTFKVLFPAVYVKTEKTDRLSSPDSAWKGSGCVLMVDDEPSVRTTAKKMLERMGFQVLLAEDGSKGVEVFRDRAREIRCVLLDLTMPHMDGEETFREMQRISPNVQVVLSSGYNQQDVVQRFVGKGLAGFIQKPYTMDALRGVLEAVIYGTPNLPQA
jgi:two-component system cell cycle sensor histidine kinase/response regulator CckA